MDKKELETILDSYIKTIKTDFYEGGKFVFWETFEVVPEVKVAENYGNNAALDVKGTTAGVEVNAGMFLFCSDGAIKFAVAHELGHAFSERVLTNIGMKGASGALTEIIADLGAAHVLQSTGSTWKEVREAVSKGVEQHIFDANWNGDHPPAKTRRDLVEKFVQLREAGKSFKEASVSICNANKGLKAPAKV